MATAQTAMAREGVGWAVVRASMARARVVEQAAAMAAAVAAREVPQVAVVAAAAVRWVASAD